MVKRFFRDLKEPLLAGPDLRNRLFEMVNKNQIAPLSRQEFAAVFEPEVNFTKKNVTFCLSRAQLGTLGYLMRQLHRISHNSAKHQMTSHNLATVFAPTLFRDEIAKDKARRKDRRGSQDNILISAREDTQVRIEAVQLLIEHANWIGLHPNCYLTSGHPRSSSAVPSPRQPPFVNMANLKQSCFVDRKYSMKERAREPFKALGERRASSTFRFITDRFLPRRSPSRDRGSVTDGGLANRRASSPALIAADNCHVKDRIAVRHDRKTPSRHMLEFAGSHTDITQPVENYNCRCRDALRSHGTRSSRARQHHSHSTTHTQQRLCGKPTTQAVSCQPAGKVVCSTAETGIASSITRRDSGKKRRESPPVRASKVLKDTPMSLVSHEHFLSSYGEGQERSRRRHTTPVKTCTALRRNQPNTLHSGLRHPKRRATVVNASEQEKENRVGRVEASDSVSSSCEDFESTLNVDESSSMLTDASADLLAQKGQESRSRRVRRQQRRESLALQRSLLDSSRIESSAVFAKGLPG
ncbi:RhoGAP domain protein [Ancylostoma caninum]|uniref:RhoGAP domain protein n=1 Tax=Ancylostoma caninum TaxID=29170 RepID=A0A368GK46_ANCCA|nr:RhoGAP domain protein [Ancylostoma caninum]